tara:strand:- start:124 stop:315 length:192 start_codon:yes stop_codon:yes gene_type:complete
MSPSELTQQLNSTSDRNEKHQLIMNYVNKINPNFSVVTEKYPTFTKEEQDDIINELLKLFKLK